MDGMTGAVVSEEVVMERAPVPPRHIKSRERVRDLGEVYTQPREVNAMLDLVPDAFADIDTRFLEPAAGNGNFLVAILERKIAAIEEGKHGGSEHWHEFALLRCLASTYGIDISDENVHEARARMTAVIDAARVAGDAARTERFARVVAALLETTVVVGDTLNAPEQIVFVEYTPLPGERFGRVQSELVPPAMDLFYEPLEPLATVHYTELGT